ncbi:hypothetical protein FB451DRAFT_1190006 [Mycena latifolia]|nr:hypothetical protein FB451DRAFT_1190006 [Mycena latifolia]
MHAVRSSATAEPRRAWRQHIPNKQDTQHIGSNREEAQGGSAGGTRRAESVYHIGSDAAPQCLNTKPSWVRDKECSTLHGRASARRRGGNWTRLSTPPPCATPKQMVRLAAPRPRALRAAPCVRGEQRGRAERSSVGRDSGGVAEPAQREEACTAVGGGVAASAVLSATRRKQARSAPRGAVRERTSRRPGSRERGDTKMARSGGATRDIRKQEAPDPRRESAAAGAHVRSQRSFWKELRCAGWRAREEAVDDTVARWWAGAGLGGWIGTWMMDDTR